MLNGKTAVYAVVGNPVAHSFSPQMQTAAFQALEINAVYVPFLVSQQSLPRLMSSIKDLNIQGFNLTIPHKQAIIPYLDELSPKAAKVQSVNTVYQKHNRWIGDTTDGVGFLNCLENCPVDYTNQPLQLLGAGGAAQAIAFELAEQGATELYIHNRTASKAEALVQRLLQHYPQLTTSAQLTEGKIGLLINATSIGADQQSLPLNKKVVSRCQAVVDIIYPHSPLLTLCQTLGKWHQNGIAMLYGQGAAAFELWTQQPAPKAIMQQALLQQINAAKN